MNYYKTLGVPHTATTEEIIAAFRPLAREHHPDKGGDPQTFAQISEAYTSLRDTQRRKVYNSILDLYGNCPACLGSTLVKKQVGFGTTKISPCPECQSTV